MSCAFRALPRLVPTILLAAPYGTEVVVVSPWIKDLELQPPILGRKGHWNTNKRMPLSSFLYYLVSKRNLYIYILVRTLDAHIEAALAPTLREYEDCVKIKTQDYLHAKAIVTRSSVLLTSANLIPTSFYRNTETCALFSNKYNSAIDYIEHELGVRLR